VSAQDGVGGAPSHEAIHDVRYLVFVGPTALFAEPPAAALEHTQSFTFVEAGREEAPDDRDECFMWVVGP